MSTLERIAKSLCALNLGLMNSVSAQCMVGALPQILVLALRDTWAKNVRTLENVLELSLQMLQYALETELV